MGVRRHIRSMLIRLQKPETCIDEVSRQGHGRMEFGFFFLLHSGCLFASLFPLYVAFISIIGQNSTA